ncbi:kinesin-like protein KIN-10A [Musa acuminata AAA Group]|uniref:kinesin-like protein KIN-10A n=1 Tax=Musa acuminata AAA Group TaxID=214697 RepID=UPI0031D77216
MAPPTPSPRSTPTTPRYHSKTTNLTPTPQQSKHRLLHFPSPNPIAKAPAAAAPTPPPPPGEHPVEVIGRIRNYPVDHRKDKPTSSVLEISGDGRSLRVRTDVGYRDFALDGVSLSEHEDLEAFYRRFVGSRVEGVRLGAKCTIMMYGPTGSGKSHTMFGCPKQPGIVYMALRDILGGGGEGDGPDGSSSDAVVDGDDDEGGGLLSGLFVKVAVLEIYNEEIYDLLSGAPNGAGGGGGGPTVGPPKGNNTPKVRLEVMGKKAKNASYICGNEAGKITREVAKVEKRRIVKSTLCNERSSRSHCMIILDVPSVGGRLMLVDMAGSENIEAAGQIGLEAKMQTAKINQGNVALKRVVESIANGDSHVPFRDSKLTMLLQDSFEDDRSKILMILCASPDPRETHKTVSTLEYGAKAKCIIRVAHMPTPKEKVDADESSLLLRSRIVAMNQFIYKLQMENKLKEKECDDAHKKLLQKESELTELRAKVRLFEERGAEVKEEEINLKVGQRTKTLRLELMKMEDRMLQQQEELNMLRQRLEEVELERGKISGDVLQDMDGGSLMKRLETFAGEQGMVKSMDLDMGDQQDSYEVKEIKEDSNQLESYQKLSQLSPCLLAFEEDTGAHMLRLPDKVCLSTVFEGDEEGEDRESIEDEVDKEVVDEDMNHAIKINGLISLVDSGLNGDHDHAEDGSDLMQKHVGAESNFFENTRDPVSARKTRIQNIFRLCGNYRELAQQVKVSSPLKSRHQDENRQSPLANGKEFGSKLGSKADQSQLTPKSKFLPESPVMESPDSAILVPFASLQLRDEEKSTDQHSKRFVSSEPSKAFKENYSSGQVGTDGFVDIYVKWEASKEFSGNLIRKLKVSKNSSLADLRKLVEISLEEGNNKFTFLMLGDPSGAPVAKEREACTQVNKLPICNNRLNSHLACLRPIKKGIQKPDHVPFDSIENTLPIKKGIQKPDHVPLDSIENTLPVGQNSQFSEVLSPKFSEINANCLTGLQV